MYVEKVNWVTFSTLYPHKDNTFLVIWCLYVTKEVMADLLKCFPSSRVRIFSNSLSFNTSWIWGPTKMPSLSLAELRAENRAYRSWKGAPSFCMVFPKFFIRPSLIWRDRRSILFLSNRLFYWTLYSSSTKVILDMQSFRNREINNTSWSLPAYS